MQTDPEKMSDKEIEQFTKKHFKMFEDRAEKEIDKLCLEAFPKNNQPPEQIKIQMRMFWMAGYENCLDSVRNFALQIGMVNDKSD